MQTPLARRRMTVAMGLQAPIPSVYQRRLWEFIDDRVPPEGEADGEFSTFQKWVNHAASYIGWTGAKCFDAKDRPCRQGGDFSRARDEDAFPVRWYLPNRFPVGRPLADRAFDLLRALAKAGAAGVDLMEVATSLGLKTIRSLPADTVIAKGWATASDERLFVTPAGAERSDREARCRARASYIKHGR